MTSEFEKFKFDVKHVESDYIKMVQGLLPKGIIWGNRLAKDAVEWIDTLTSTEIKQDSNTSDNIKQDTQKVVGDSGDLLALVMSTLGSELSRLEALAWQVLNATDPGVTEGAILEDWERNLDLPISCYVNQTLDQRQRAAHSKRFDEYISTTNQAYIDKAATLGFEITINEAPEEYQPFILDVATLGVESIGGTGGYNVLEITIVSGDGDVDLLKCELNKFKHADAILVYV